MYVCVYLTVSLSPMPPTLYSRPAFARAFDAWPSFFPGGGEDRRAVPLQRGGPGEVGKLDVGADGVEDHDVLRGGKRRKLELLDPAHVQPLCPTGE